MSAVMCQLHDGQGRQHRRLDDSEVAAAGGSLVEQIAGKALDDHRRAATEALL